MSARQAGAAAERHRIVTAVLERWAIDIRAHRSEAVAAGFTTDALFQGFDPAPVIGRPGIAAYYDKQPLGLDPRFAIVDHRELADDVLIAYVDVDFVRPEGVVIPVHLTVVLLRQAPAGDGGGERRGDGGGDGGGGERGDDDAWLIGHYHVSKIG
ncbi:hypothetical protein [Plantibacter sp. YIM 135347]|uniref:hypothetical protein n=1 Tax=Plantibacter sp. YIM 135347 TaxID=3423919 RepID=UPI003D3341A2